MKLELEAASPFARPHLSPWREKHTSTGGHAHSLAFPVHTQLTLGWAATVEFISPTGGRKRV